MVGRARRGRVGLIELTKPKSVASCLQDHEECRTLRY
jgi:hypothetical protein